MIRSAIFYSPSGYQFSVRFPSPVTCVVNRELFDQHLCSIASKAGAQILKNSHVESFLIEKRVAKGVIVRKGKRIKKFASKVVIDAEGLSSSLLKRAGFPPLNSKGIINGVHAEVDRIDEINTDSVEVFFDRNFASGFFAWIVPRRDGTAKIGLGSEKGNPSDCLQKFVYHNPIVRKKFKHSHITRISYHPISLGGPIQKTFHDGLLIVGDAASHVKPTTGGGIIMGLTGAKFAGETAAKAVLHGDSSAVFLSEYEKRWKKEMRFDMIVMKRLRLILSSLSNKKFDQLIALCARLKLNETLMEVRDVDFQGTSLIQLAKSPGMLTAALYFFIFGLHSMLSN
jgi:digeranylgeranylglycerophospholipid reductase